MSEQVTGKISPIIYMSGDLSAVTTIAGTLSDIQTLTGSASTEFVLSGSISPVLSITGSLRTDDSVTGTISPVFTLCGSITRTQNIQGGLSVPEVVEAETYMGEYNITPSTTNDIILDTAYKTLRNNINVYKIPYFETSNEKGYTVYIGGEL